MNSVVVHANRLIMLLGDWKSLPGGPTGRMAGFRALAERIELLVIDGRLAPGTRLPSERELASALGVSRTTVTAAYARLRESGTVLSLRGSGTVVRGSRASMPVANGTPAGEVIDLVQASPAAWPGLEHSIQAVASGAGVLLASLGYEMRGLLSLREAIARRYTERGLPTGIDQVLITTGAQAAIALIARTLAQRGDRVLIESPTYPHAYEALREAGGRLVSAPVTAEGWDIETFEAQFQRAAPSVAYLIPDFHNPTGQSMSVVERRRIIQAAAAVGTVLIIDETTAELDIDGGGNTLPFAALGEDTSATILTVGSVGKTMWGGLRVGWIRAEPALLERLSVARVVSDLGTPDFEQAVVADAFTRMDEILAHRSAALRRTRALVERRLGELIPEWQVPHVHGGVATWVNLGHPVSSRIALAARTHGLLLTAGPKFGIDGAFERFLRIPITADADVLALGLDRLALAWRQTRESSVGAVAPDTALV